MILTETLSNKITLAILVEYATLLVTTTVILFLWSLLKQILIQNSSLANNVFSSVDRYLMKIYWYCIPDPSIKSLYRSGKMDEEKYRGLQELGAINCDMSPDFLQKK